jgi:tetratricopeptide (TPR) repeat protein
MLDFPGAGDPTLHGSLEMRAAGPTVFPPRDVLFGRSLIDEYTRAPVFIQRKWLENQIRAYLGESSCRFVLITAEPGAGKTALLASLAAHEPGWVRYFIRRDSTATFNRADARSLLISIGCQLAILFPEAFLGNPWVASARQQIGTVTPGAEVTGIKVDRMADDPFVRFAAQFHSAADLQQVSVEQKITHAAGRVTAAHIGALTNDVRLLEISDLQDLALDRRAHLLANRTEPIVVMIDALDDVRFQNALSGPTIVKWLESCGELPSNVRVIIASRPDRLLDQFIVRQQPSLRELEMISEATRASVRDDVRQFVSSHLSKAHINDALVKEQRSPEWFTKNVVDRSAGNFQYAASLFHAIDQAMMDTTGLGRQAVTALLTLTDVPAGLSELYSYLLKLVRGAAEQDPVPVPAPDESRLWVQAWEYLCVPILGLLAAARAPLRTSDLVRFARFEAEEQWVQRALERLSQFLRVEFGGYRLYHDSFGEFLTTRVKRDGTPNPWYVDPARWHRHILQSYGGLGVNWDTVDWRVVDDYGVLHIAQHLSALASLQGDPGAAEADTAIARQSLYELVQWDLLQEKLLRFGTHQAFLTDVELALKAAGSEDPPNILQEVRCSLVHASIVSAVSSAPPGALAALVLAGDLTTPLTLLALIRDPLARVRCTIGIADVLITTGNAAIASSMLLDTLRVVRELSSPALFADYLQELAEPLGRVGELARVVGEARTLAAGAAGSVMASVASANAALGDIDEARRIAGELEPRHRATALLGIARICRQQQRVDTALSILDEVALALQHIENDDVRESGTARVATERARLGRFDLGIQTAEQFRIREVKAQALSEIALESVQQKRHEGVEDLLGEALRLVREREDEILGDTDQQGNPRPLHQEGAAGWSTLFRWRQIPLTISMVTRAYELMGLHDKAVNVRRYTRSVENLDVVTEEIAKIAAENGEAERAVRLAELLLRRGARADFLVTLLPILAEAGRVDRALLELERLPASSRKTRVEGVMALWFAKKGDSARAVQYARRALRGSNSVPQNERGSIGGTLRYAPRFILQYGDLDLAIEVARGLPSPSDQAVALSQLVDFLNRHGRLKEANRVAEDIVAIATSYPGVWTSGIADDLLPVLGATRLLDVALSMTEGGPQHWLIGDLVRGLAERGETARAETLLNRMADPHYRARGAFPLAIAFARDGDVERALALATRAEDRLANGHPMNRLPRRVLDTPSGSVTQSGPAYGDVLLAVARGLARLGRVAELQGILRQLGHGPHTDKVRQEAAIELALRDQLPRALQIANERGSAEQKKEMLASIGVGVAEAGQTEQALRIARQLDATSSLPVLTAAAMESARSADFDKALGLATEVISRVTGAATIARSVLALCEAAVVLDQIGLRENAIQAVERAAASKRSALALESQNDLASRIAATFAALGMLEKSLEITRTIRGALQRRHAYEATIRASQAASRVTDAAAAWHAALELARNMSPEEVLETLEAGMPVIAEEYGAKELAKICHHLGDVERWWGTDDSDLEDEDDTDEEDED